MKGIRDYNLVNGDKLEELRIKSNNFYSGEDCSVWQGAFDHRGYGIICIKVGHYKYRNFFSHRAVYHHLVAPVEKDLAIDHLCRNHSCVNPKHLEAVSWGENILRGDTLSGNAKRATACSNGHPYTEKTTYSYGNGWRRCKVCDKARKRLQDPRDCDEHTDFSQWKYYNKIPDFAKAIRLEQ